MTDTQNCCQVKDSAGINQNLFCAKFNNEFTHLFYVICTKMTLFLGNMEEKFSDKWKF